MKPIFKHLCHDRFLFYLEFSCNIVIGMIIGVIVGVIIVCRMESSLPQNLPPNIQQIDGNTIIVIKK